MADGNRTLHGGTLQMVPAHKLLFTLYGMYSDIYDTKNLYNV